MITLFLATLICYGGDHKLGEIEIVTDPKQIASIEELQKQRLIKKGLTEADAKESSRTGIVAEDIYWIWERDAVLFPTGFAGTYNRLTWKSANGIAILPILPDGRVALNLNFRHATRSWEFELPRGRCRGGEGLEEAVRRELQEETGLVVQKLSFLGSMACDTGVLASVIPVYAGWVGEAGAADQEESEAIAGIRAFTFQELEDGLRKGYVEVDPQGKVPFRDSFLTFALFQAKNKVEMVESPKVGIGVIVVDGNRVLIGKRRGSHGSGTWGFPGGHLEFGETAETCAARELFEETGLRALSMKKGAWTNDLIDESKHYVTLFMVVDQFEGTLQIKEPEKCEGWEWQSWDQLPEPLFAPIISLKKQNIRPF